MSKKSCINPTDSWVCGLTVSKDGVTSPRLVFSYKEALEYFSKIYPALEMAVTYLERYHHPVDCGKCPNCLLRKRQAMALRLVHERSQVEDCCFITLTYNPKSLPRTCDGKWSEGHKMIIGRGDMVGVPTLVPSDVQRFMKRLRRHLEYTPIRIKDRRDHVTKPIRYFCVGEYGGKTGRPHYHVIVFGWKPSDMVFHQQKKNYCLYRSAQIEKLWTDGFSTIGEVTYGVANYCARYVTKKYRDLGKRDSAFDSRCPEFTLQSVRHGGMGAPWLERYRQNLVHGYVTVRDKNGAVVKCSVPPYYYDRLRKVDLPLWLDLRDQRIDFIQSRAIKSHDEAEVEMFESVAHSRKVVNDWLEELSSETF